MPGSGPVSHRVPFELVPMVARGYPPVPRRLKHGKVLTDAELR